MYRLPKTTTGMMIGLLAVLASCRKEELLPGPGKMAVYTVPYQDTLRGAITEPTLLVNNRTWYIDGLVYVGNEASLVIEPGTVIRIITDKHKKEQGAIKGGLIVTRGAKIVANGTSFRPVRFTVTDSSGIGGWCGLVVLGRAPVNKAYAAYNHKGLMSGLAYGGNLPDDSSGVLQHVHLDHINLILLGTGKKTVVNKVATRAVTAKQYLLKDLRQP